MYIIIKANSFNLNLQVKVEIQNFFFTWYPLYNVSILYNYLIVSSLYKKWYHLSNKITTFYSVYTKLVDC